MENLRKRRRIDLVQDPDRLKKLVAQPAFKSVKIFNENMAAVERYKSTPTLNKPIYVGFTVLDLSRVRILHVIWKNRYYLYYEIPTKK